MAKGVGMVDLAQYIIRQTDTVDPPAAVQRRSRGRAQLRRMIEVLAVSLKEAKMGRPELLDAPARLTIRPEQTECGPDPSGKTSGPIAAPGPYPAPPPRSRHRH